MIEAILFDFDGTLADTVEGILLTMKQTMAEMGRPVPSDEEMVHTIGLPLAESLRIAGNFSKDETEKAVETYRRLFPIYELEHIRMFPNVPEIIKVLRNKGLRLAICTSRGSGSLTRILSRYDLAVEFETIVSASDGLPSKPAPDMVNVILERMGLTPEDAVVVGDTTFDIGMGKAAGCRTCAVTYGNHTRAQLESMNPEWMIDSFPEIEQITALQR